MGRNSFYFRVTKTKAMRRTKKNKCVLLEGVQINKPFGKQISPVEFGIILELNAKAAKELRKFLDY
jgi:hypothetical protein